MKREAPPTEHVTTEPQRLALEAMSQDLVKKLNCMVAEQETRAREFAAHQHSLSSLPVQTPSVATAPTRHKPKQKHYHKQTPPPPPAYTPPTYTQTNQTPEPIYTDTYLPPVPSAAPAPRKKAPTVIGGRKKKEEEGIGVGTIITVIFIVFILMSRGCS